MVRWPRDALDVGRLLLISADGFESVTLTPPVGSRDARWSPDGTRLAFVSLLRDGRDIRDISVINRDGTGLVGLSYRPADLSPLTQAFGPEWSPDGSRLVFQAVGHEVPCGESKCGFQDVFVVNVDGSGLERLTNNGAINDYDPRWSPDGRRIAFVTNRDSGCVVIGSYRCNPEVYLMNPDGSDLLNLTQNPATSDYAPRWIPR